jgi:hypothetical protein
MFRLCWRSRWNRLVLVAALLGASASLGCGSKTATVSGTISYKGEKLGNGNVTFVGDKGQAAASPIKADGTYSMTNVPLGTVKIKVETIPPAEGSSQNRMGVDMPDMKGKEKDLGKYVKIPDRYKDSEKSGLTYQVKPGKHKHNIDLD